MGFNPLFLCLIAWLTLIPNLILSIRILWLSRIRWVNFNSCHIRLLPATQTINKIRPASFQHFRPLLKFLCLTKYRRLHAERNVVVEWLTHLLRREISGSNLGPGDRLSWLRGLMFYSVPPGECLDSTLILDNDRFLLSPFQIIIHLSSKLYFLKKRRK
jgi:hypothetical protein